MATFPLYRFGMLFAVWLAIYHESIASMVSVWTSSKTYEHGMIIVPIAVWLVWRKKAQLKHTGFTFSYLPLVLMLLPAALWLVGKAAEIALFEHIALVFSLQLLIWFSIGNEKAKILFFPIFYLVFCVPFGEEFIPFLQVITADITVYLVQLSGIPIYRDGLFLSIPNGMFEVAEACSGIRFLISSVALGFLFSYLSFTKYTKHLIFILFSFIFPIIANGIRAYSIVLIGYYSDMQHAVGADHLIYGWVFFSLVTISIFLIANKFADNPIPVKVNYRPLSKKNNRSPITYHALSLCLLAIFSTQLVWKHRLNTLSQKTEKETIVLPHQFTPLSTSLWGIDFPSADNQILAKKLDSTTQLYLAASSFNSAKGEFIHHHNKLYDQDYWTRVAHSTFTLNNKIKARLTEIVNHLGVNRYIVHWYCINDYCTNDRNIVKLLKAFHVILGNEINLNFTAIFTEKINNEEIENLANRVNANKEKTVLNI